MNPMDMDTRTASRAGFATSRVDDRERWTELAIWYFPLGTRPWLAEQVGRSIVPGEVDKVRRLASGRLLRALSLFDDSDLSRIVASEAADYASENALPVLPAGETVPKGDRNALHWLFDVGPADDAPSIRSMARDLDMSESTLRIALAKDEIRVPLRSLLPFVDRAAFHRSRTREGANG